MPAFGWGESGYDLWWVMVSTITLGVGIGVLAQPQMAVRFMTVKSKRDIVRGVPIGGFFILVLVGGVYTVGPLTNVFFHEKEEIVGFILNKDEVKSAAEGTRKGVQMAIRSVDGQRETRVPFGAKTEVVWGAGDQPDRIRPHLISIGRTADLPSACFGWRS